MNEEDKLWKDVRRLNALLGSYSAFVETTARKEHEDEFGNKINEGELYFKRQVGEGYHQVVKISKNSMNQIIEIIFGRSQHLVDLADKILEADMEKLRNAMEKMSNMFHPPDGEK